MEHPVSSGPSRPPCMGFLGILSLALCVKVPAGGWKGTEVAEKVGLLEGNP